MHTQHQIDRYFSGQALYGDDFSVPAIEDWFAEEKEAYAELGAKHSSSYEYKYHEWNRYHAFQYLPRQRFDHVLGFGSAYAHELLPVLEQSDSITVVDPSAAFAQNKLRGVSVAYVEPKPIGDLPFPDQTFDLITCFGVLHHIANVSYVIGELVRTLRPGGYFVLREPIVSMGDWRVPRRGLTKRERGIPLPILQGLIASNQLHILRESLCDFPLTRRIFRPFRSDVFNSKVAVRLDSILANGFRWNLRYHATSNFGRLRPSSVFLVLQKPPLS